MRSSDAVVEDIVRTLRQGQVAQVPDYAPFTCSRRAGEAIRVGDALAERRDVRLREHVAAQ
jgi:hypothetical protein